MEYVYTQWYVFTSRYSCVGLNHLVGYKTISHEWSVIKGVWKHKLTPLSAAPGPALRPTHTLLVTVNLGLNLDAIVVGSVRWKL